MVGVGVISGGARKNLEKNESIRVLSSPLLLHGVMKSLVCFLTTIEEKAM